MGKVQDYLKQKKIKESGLRKIYIVESTREGVSDVMERQVIDIKQHVSTIFCGGDNKVNIPVHRYFLETESYPFNVDIEEGEESTLDEGYGSGFGDLWEWSYFSSFSIEEAQEFKEKETKRVEQNYL